MIPKHISDTLLNNKFSMDFEDGCAVYKKYYKTAIFGDIQVDVFDGKGFKPQINIVKDCEEIISHDLTAENIEMCISEINKISL